MGAIAAIIVWAFIQATYEKNETLGNFVVYLWGDQNNSCAYVLMEGSMATGYIGLDN